MAVTRWLAVWVADTLRYPPEPRADGTELEQSDNGADGSPASHFGTGCVTSGYRRSPAPGGTLPEVARPSGEVSTDRKS